MKNMRYFISQPMRGKTEEEIMAERNMVIAAMQLANPEAEYIDSVLEHTPKDGKPALWCLGESLKLLSTADMCIFVGDWRYARGCCIEYLACRDYGVICYVFNSGTGVLESVGV